MTTDPVDTSLVVRIKVGHQPRYLLALLWVAIILLWLIFSTPITHPSAYLLVAFFGAALATFAFLVLPQFNYLELQRSGFVLHNLRVTSSFRWQDVQRIETFNWQKRELIGLNLSGDIPVKDRVENQKKWGWDLVLTAHYELPPQEIVDMMNAYRLG